MQRPEPGLPTLGSDGGPMPTRAPHSPAMEDPDALILQLSDLVSTRKCAMRIDAGDSRQTLDCLLYKYVKHAPIQDLLRTSRIIANSADSLFALQDLLYVSADSGQLLDMFDGVAFKQGDRLIGPEDTPQRQLASVDNRDVWVIDLSIDRTNCDYDRNWTGFHARKWLRDADKYAKFVYDTLAESLGSAEAESVMEMDSTEKKLTLLESLARRVWTSQFENYSRFVGKKLVYKSGDETIDNIMDGGGAICSEKVQALKFLTDHYGITSEYVIAGGNAVGTAPVEKLRELLVTFDFRFAKRYMRFWQHTALLYDVDGVQVLVDATNGNIPFLFLLDQAAERVLGHRDKQPVTVKMIESKEDFYYHRVPQDIPENLFFALEGWMPYTDLMQVFDNELGLYLSADFYVTPIPFTTEREFEQDRREYERVCRRCGLECSVTREWTLDSPVGIQFSRAEPLVSEHILAAKDHLLARLDECEGVAHQSGLVVMRLKN